MKRFGQLIRVRPEFGQYIKYHAQVWPRCCRPFGIATSTTIPSFLRTMCSMPNFEYGTDFEADMKKMAQIPRPRNGGSHGLCGTQFPRGLRENRVKMEEVFPH
jgi:L-rhamnose mutarotase